jgi:hypothetical protein
MATRWTQDDFALLSWHDNQVHALHIPAGDGGADELELDLDHLLEGLPAGGTFRFRITPTRLRFYE